MMMMMNNAIEQDDSSTVPDPLQVSVPSAAAAACALPAASNPRKKRTKLSNSPAGEAGVVVKLKKQIKKPDPSAPKITRPCTECGKKFWSWKALFGHMRCHPERQWRGINPPPNFRNRPPPPSLEQGIDDDRDVAACLLMLANSPCPFPSPIINESDHNCRFECSSCRKVFSTHQALGGHRASHRNVKGCFANDDDLYLELMTRDHHDNHKCSICSRVFSTGQALGGHMRCHWEKSAPPGTVLPPPSTESSSYQPAVAAAGRGGLDLNYPMNLESSSCLCDDCHGFLSSSSYYSSSLGLDLDLDLRLGL